MINQSRKMYLIVGIIIAFATVFGASAPASANKDYSDAVSVAPELFIHADGQLKSQPINVSTTWLDELSQSYERRIAHNPSGWPSNFISLLKNARSTGSYGVTVTETYYGNEIKVFGTDDPNASCGFEEIPSTWWISCQVSAGFSTFSAEYITHSSFGGNGCGGGTCSDRGMNMYSPPTVWGPTSGGVFYAIDGDALENGTTSIFVLNFDVSYPLGYNGIEIPSAYSASYVALGDSYASGEGNPPYEYGSDTMSNTCHRSAVAYPRLVENALGTGVETVACSGAVSDYISSSYNLENVELPQVVAISSDTDYVSVSIGGNDIGFSQTIEACVSSNTPQACLDAAAIASSNALDPEFTEKIRDTLLDIRSETSSSAKIIALGYPHIYSSYESISGACTWGSWALALISNEVSGRSITEAEIDALREVHDNLNSAINDAVAETSDTNIVFVDPTDSFEGHEICGPEDDWLHEVHLHVSTATVSVGSFHPNAYGQEAYAGLILSEIGG